MWKNDEYYYGVGTLRTIAYHYESIYEGIGFILGATVTDQWSIAEYVADFDMAWKSLPAKMQKIIEYDIQDLTDKEIEDKGFYNPNKYKKMAYNKMVNYLNKGI